MPDRLRHAPLLMMLLAGLLLLIVPATVTAQAAPGLADLPRRAAPFGLGASILPADKPVILGLFAALPSQLGGYAQQPVEQLPDRIVAAWGAPDPMVGNPLRLTALHFPDGDFFPEDFTAGQYVAMACATDDFEATACGRDGDLAWIRAATTVSTGGDKPGTPPASTTLHTLAWGGVDAPWLFSAAATTPEGLEALITAFLVAIADFPATPATGTANPLPNGIIDVLHEAVRAGGRACRR